MKPAISKITPLVFAAAAFCSMVSVADAGTYAGVQQIEAPSKERQRDLSVTVWYPADAGGKQVTLGENQFFSGTDALLGAPISAGKHPLILLSHGAGLAGTPEAVSWIAAPLAKQGFIVGAPRHPGNGGTEKSASETMKLWLRPADLSASLDALEKHPLFAEHLAANQTGVLGLSMGGTTALALAGARFDPVRLASYCDTDMHNPSLCGWIKQSRLDLHSMDMHFAGRNNEDKRIAFVIAIDPAPVDVIQPASLLQIAVPVDIVNLGQKGVIPRTALADQVAKAIPQGRYFTIENASHYSMFGICKPDAARLAELEEVGDPICSDGSGASRLNIHQQIISLVVQALRRQSPEYQSRQRPR